uniref:DH domain-containing protein n=1 Tax=Panagrolaimus superbus TaxID=310955 RepID=A0A914YCE8_9BILA
MYIYRIQIASIIKVLQKIVFQLLTLDAIRDLLDSYRALPQTLERAAVEKGSLTRINGRGVTPTTGRQYIAKTATDMGLLEVWATPRQSIVSDDDSEDELMNTDIEELRDAVESIQSLQRVLKLPNQHSNGSSPTNDSNPILHGSTSESSSMKGITTNLGGHPRGVMQFLPSAKNNQFQPTLDSYTWTKQQPTTIPQLLRRKASVPENYLQFSGSERSSPRPRPSMRIFRASETEPDLFASSNMGNNKGVDSIAGISRFSKLLNSLRSAKQDPEQWQYQPNFLMPPETNIAQRQLQQSLMQADQLLWKRRSRASLRRHQDIRNMAVRELFDTERTFVESLEYLVQKYMRPLKQPLECTLIDADLVDKIFYKIPEILAHHQVLYAALSSRLEFLQNDTVIGDVLLAHFTKQSMIETFMAFVDNFKHAKQAIWDARQRPAFEKYYMRCSREHRNKLDLDSLLILPIQRVPRYELILKQIVKHTSVEHCDYEKLILVQDHVHQLAVAINCQREEKEKMEQRLREIEAIVDGLDDLVSPGRTFNRYDVVTVRDTKNEKKQRCIFMMSDQMIVTSIYRRPLITRGSGRGQTYSQSPDFLDNNRFKLLIKISLYDVEIGQDTIPLLQNAEQQLRNAQEDVNIVSKIMDLTKLLKSEHNKLSEHLDEMYTQRVTHLKALQDQMTSNPDLTTVNLQVTTFEGIETFTIQFPNAEKRALWENGFLEAKNVLRNTLHNEQSPPLLKSILVHRARQGLTFNVAMPAIIKGTEGAPNVWLCSSDKFSGQIAILSAVGDPTVESTTNLGNSALKAICAVPATGRRRTRSKITETIKSDKSEIELDSSSSDLDYSDSESVSPAQSTMWIGNEDGEIFIFNYLDNVRLKAREKAVRLPLPIVDITYVEERVFVSLSSKSQNQLVYFTRSKGTKTSALTSDTSEIITIMASLGSIIFVAFEKQTNVKLLNAFTLDCLSEFSITPVINKTLSTKEDIIRNHKLGSLRITTMLCARNQLWVGTSAGILLTTPVNRNKSNWVPNFNVCSIGHIGPCRFLTSVNISPLASAINLNKRRMSLNAPSLQQYDQIYVISGGNGVENYSMSNNNEETGVDDACNHLVFWQI